MQEHYLVTDITKATWIMTPEVTTIPLLLNFSTAELPEYLRITGEYTLTRVYPYNERPSNVKIVRSIVTQRRDVLVRALSADGLLNSI